MAGKRRSVPVTYIRGGTSKALFFHENDLSEMGFLRDSFLKRAMGSPDPMQIDGMGGSHIVTSKVAIIKPSQRNDADVDYTFAQVSISSDDISYAGNCGNISAGVGPFAVDEGLVKEIRVGLSIDPKIKTREVRMYNTGTEKILISHVLIDESSGRSLEAGEFAIAGCPGKGAPILIDFRNVVSRSLGHRMLPLGSVISIASVGSDTVKYTLCDAGNLFIFARAEEFGLEGTEHPANLDARQQIISSVKEMPGKVAQVAGMCQNWINVDEESPMTPMVVLVSKPTEAEAHIQSRLFLDNKCHTSMAGTGGIALAACSRIAGSIVNDIMSSKGLEDRILHIQHPLGIMPISVETPLQDETTDPLPEFATLSLIRTSRRILDGRQYIPDDFKMSTDDTQIFSERK